MAMSGLGGRVHHIRKDVLFSFPRAEPNLPDHCDHCLGSPLRFQTFSLPALPSNPYFLLPPPHHFTPHLPGMGVLDALRGPEAESQPQ